MWSLLVGLLSLCGLFVTLIGAFCLFHLLKPKRPPMDGSNRINHIRLFWFVLTRPELFVKTFPWLENDEFDNVKG